MRAVERERSLMTETKKKFEKNLKKFLTNTDCCGNIYEQQKFGSIAKLVRQQTATLSSSVQVRLEPPTMMPRWRNW